MASTGDNVEGRKEHFEDMNLEPGLEISDGLKPIKAY